MKFGILSHIEDQLATRAADEWVRENVEDWQDIPVIPQYEVDLFKAGAAWMKSKFKRVLDSDMEAGE